MRPKSPCLGSGRTLLRKRVQSHPADLFGAIKACSSSRTSGLIFRLLFSAAEKMRWRKPSSFSRTPRIERRVHAATVRTYHQSGRNGLKAFDQAPHLGCQHTAFRLRVVTLRTHRLRPREHRCRWHLRSRDSRGRRRTRPRPWPQIRAHAGFSYTAPRTTRDMCRRRSRSTTPAAASLRDCRGITHRSAPKDRLVFRAPPTGHISYSAAIVRRQRRRCERPPHEPQPPGRAPQAG